MRDMDIDDLADQLSDFDAPDKPKGRPAIEPRVIAGFEDIQRFYEKHGRPPAHGEDGDIFERIYAVRLGRLRSLADYREILEPLDHQGLLVDAPAMEMQGDVNLDDLASELGDDESSEITTLRHVRSTSEKKAAERVADRKRCEDFIAFESKFNGIKADLNSGARMSVPFGQYATIEVGQWFILDGQMAYVAEEGEEFDSPQGKRDARLRVIFSNKTESDMLRLSLVRALYKDESSRRITEPDMGPLFSDSLEEGDLESGTVYVLRSFSDNPFVFENRTTIHKIGVTGGKVESRIANAEHEATYLLAKVEVVATYKLSGINRTAMEKLFHRLFAAARLAIAIQDRFGNPVEPREWFLVPLHVIDEAVMRIVDGSITRVTYDLKTASLVEGL